MQWKVHAKLSFEHHWLQEATHPSQGSPFLASSSVLGKAHLNPLPAFHIPVSGPSENVSCPVSNRLHALKLLTVACVVGGRRRKITAEAPESLILVQTENKPSSPLTNPWFFFLFPLTSTIFFLLSLILASPLILFSFSHIQSFFCFLLFPCRLLFLFLLLSFLFLILSFPFFSHLSLCPSFFSSTPVTENDGS